MSNPVGDGRAAAVFTLGALIVTSGALATASCTYDYQGALGATTASSAASGGASSSSSGLPASSSGAGGRGGAGGAGGGGGATQSSSTGGPVACPPMAGQITNVTNDAAHGDVAWKPCGSGSVGLTQNLEADDLAVDCVALTPTKISEWLRVSFTFAGLPADAVVTEIKVSIRRGADADLEVEDRHAWIQPLDTLETVDTTVGPWPEEPTFHDYTLDKTYAPGEVSGADLVLQVMDISNNMNVTPKVGYATAEVSYSASACP